LLEICLPETMQGKRSAQKYIKALIRSSLAEGLIEEGGGES
jgi:hypothetical protein